MLTKKKYDQVNYLFHFLIEIPQIISNTVQATKVYGI
jgi:hypothetical protein